MGTENLPAVPETQTVAPVSRKRVRWAQVTFALGVIGKAATSIDAISKAVSPSELRAVTLNPWAWFFDHGFSAFLWLLIIGSVIYLFWVSLANRLSRQGIALEKKIDALSVDFKSKLDVMKVTLQAEIAALDSRLRGRIDELDLRLETKVAALSSVTVDLTQQIGKLVEANTSQTHYSHGIASRIDKLDDDLIARRKAEREKAEREREEKK